MQAETTKRTILTIATLLAMVCQLFPAPCTRAAEPLAVVPIWPDQPPGDSAATGQEAIVQGRRRPFYQITNVATPTLSVFVPPENQRTGAAVLVLPGGALQRLAWEHEGLEVADWLVSRNIVACVLKYRVPAPATTGLRDAQRAMGLIRQQSAAWGVDPTSVGVLGFSAGGEIAAWLATHHQQREYDPIDQADAQSCRPDFAALIYPGGIVSGRTATLKDPIASQIDQHTPAMFFVHAFDDSCENSLAMVLALKRARVPAELHIYQEGGHGFGPRVTGSPVHTWKDRFEDWLQLQGFLDPAFIRDYEGRFAAAIDQGANLPRFTQSFPQAQMTDAYRVQRRLVRRLLARDQLAGFKGGIVTAAAQQRFGVDRPVTGVLFQSGKLSAGQPPVVDLTKHPETMIETELGFVISVDISYRLANTTQVQGAVESIVPVIELPDSYAKRLGEVTAVDLVAANVGSAMWIVGDPQSPDSVDPDSVPIVLSRNNELLHEATGSAVIGGQWQNLHALINQIVDQGYTIPQGSIIISGALGQVHPAQAGHYRASYGPLGRIEFELEAE